MSPLDDPCLGGAGRGQSLPAGGWQSQSPGLEVKTSEPKLACCGLPGAHPNPCRPPRKLQGELEDVRPPQEPTDRKAAPNSTQLPSLHPSVLEKTRAPPVGCPVAIAATHPPCIPYPHLFTPLCCPHNIPHNQNLPRLFSVMVPCWFSGESGDRGSHHVLYT